jgi:hypothetical protein
MNKYLAGYLFAGETIFNIKMAGSTTAPLSTSVEPAVKSVKPVENPPPPDAPIIVEESLKVLAQPSISQKSLLLVVNSPSSSERELLTKIMQSVKQNIADAEIIDVASLPNVTLSNYSSVKEIISFGVAMSKLGSDLLLFPYQLQEREAKKYLIVDDLKTIQANQKDEKRLLWGALKGFYGI